MAVSIPVLGMTTWDTLLAFDEIASEDEAVSIAKHRVSRPGGKGFIVAQAVAGMGCDAPLISEIAVEGSRFDDLEHAIRVLDTDSETWIASSPNHQATWVHVGRPVRRPDRLGHLRDVSGGGGWLYVSAESDDLIVGAQRILMEDPDLNLVLNLCMPLIAGVGLRLPSTLQYLAGRASIIVMNAKEFAALPATVRPHVEKGDNHQLCVVTAGSQGGCWRSLGVWERYEAVGADEPVKIAVGAGDWFNGSLMGGLAQGMGPRDGVAAAARSVSAYLTDLNQGL